MKNNSFPKNKKINLVEILEKWWGEIEQDEFHPSLDLELNDPPEMKQIKTLRRQIAHRLDMGIPASKIESAAIAMANLDTELTRHFVVFSENNIRLLSELGYIRVGQAKHEFKTDDELFIFINSAAFGLVNKEFLDKNNIDDKHRLSVINSTFIKRLG